MGFVTRWLLNALALAFTAWIITGITVTGIVPLLVASAILGILNAVIRPILLIITLPINLFTLGLFTFVINGVLLMVTSSVVQGFHVAGFWPAVIGALLLAIISFVLSSFVGDRGEIRFIRRDR
jgi:putative membrane protein